MKLSSFNRPCNDTEDIQTLEEADMVIGSTYETTLENLARTPEVDRENVLWGEGGKEDPVRWLQDLVALYPPKANLEAFSLPCFDNHAAHHLINFRDGNFSHDEYFESALFLRIAAGALPGIVDRS